MLNLINGNTYKVPQSPEAETLWGGMPYPLLFAVLVFLLFISNIYKKKNPKLSTFFFISFFIVIAINLVFLNLGSYNNILEKVGSKTINSIKITPSAPNWKVNLTDSIVTIKNQIVIDSILSLIRNSKHYSPSHPFRKWETKMTLYINFTDSLEIEINQTTDNATIIYSNADRYKNNKLGVYLENLMKYTNPLYSKDATIRNPN